MGNISEYALRRPHWCNIKTQHVIISVSFQESRFDEFGLHSDFGGNFNSPDQFGAHRPEYFDDHASDFASGGGGGGYRPSSNYKRPSSKRPVPPGLGSRVGLLSSPYPGLGVLASVLRGLSYLVNERSHLSLA